MSSKLSVILGDCERAANELLASGVRFGLIKIHNSIKIANMLRAVWGDDTLFILRMTATEHIISDGMTFAKKPDVIAAEWFNATVPAMEQAPWAFFEIGGPGFNSDTPGYADYYADVIEAAMRLMHARGFKGVVLTFYEGTPHTLSDGSGSDGWAPYWSIVNLAAQYGFLLGPQGYWIDGKMDLADDWHNFRLLRVLRDYPGKFPPGTRFVKTEAFIDLRNGKGWKTALGNDAARLEEGLEAEDRFWRTASLPAGVEFLAACGFVLQEWGTEWDDFNLWEVLPYLLPYIKSQQDIIEVFPAPEPAPAPEPEPPSGLAAVKTQCSAGQNIRRYPSYKGALVGEIAPGEVGYTSLDERLSIGQEASWVKVKTAKAEGWCAAWLLRAA